MPICCVIGCTNRFIKGGSVKFYRIPADRERKNKWLASISRENWKPSSWSGICGAHFVSGKPSSDSSNTDFVPSLKLGNENVNPNPPMRFTRVSKGNSDFAPSLKVGNGNVGSNVPLRSRKTPELVNVAPVCITKRTHDVVEAVPLCGRVKGDRPSENVLDEKCTRQFRQQLLPLSRKRRQETDLRSEINLLKRKIRTLEDLNEKTKFGESFLRGDDNRTSCMTGIPTYTAFCWLLSVCHSVLPKSRFLSPGDTLIMILSKLKLNLNTQDLSGRYNISEPRVAQISELSIPLLAKKLQSLSRDDHVVNLPEEFKQGIYRVLLLLTLKQHL